MHQRRDVGGAGDVRHPQHRDQHQDRAEQRVEEEFVAGIDAVGTAPHADDQIHRDQAGFEEDVEQEQVLRREHADHQQFHDQERGHVFADASGDRFPAGENADRHQEHAERDQDECDPVDPERIGETREELLPFGELPLCAADIEIEPQHRAQCEVDQRCDQRDHPRELRVHEQAGDRRDERHEEHQREDGKIHYNSPVRVERSRDTSHSRLSTALEANG